MLLALCSLNKPSGLIGPFVFRKHAGPAAVLRHEAALRWSDDMAAALPMCYHGAISRKECEDLLGKKNKDGAYLIRDSETIQGAMCLCV